MKYSGHRKLLCELSKFSKFYAFILLGYYSNTDASILVYKQRPERTGFNMYAENARQQLTFLALLPCLYSIHYLNMTIEHGNMVFFFNHSLLIQCTATVHWRQDNINVNKSKKWSLKSHSLWVTLYKINIQPWKSVFS